MALRSKINYQGCLASLTPFSVISNQYSVVTSL